jgi:cytochrome P450
VSPVPVQAREDRSEAKRLLNQLRVEVAEQQNARTRAKLFDPIIDEESQRRADAAAETIFAYFRDLRAKRRAELQNDLLSALITTRDEGDALTDDELVNLVLRPPRQGSHDPSLPEVMPAGMHASGWLVS